MKVTPYPQQIKGAEYLVKNRGGCLWMEMRTGKTLTTLMALKQMRAFPALIIGPGHVFAGWEDQLLTAGGKWENITRLVGTKKQVEKKLDNPNPCLNLMNYAQTWRRDVLDRKWGSIILDESIRVGNMDTQVTEYFLENAHKNTDSVKICLSGSPATERVVQLVPQHFWQRNGEIMGYNGPEGFDDYFREQWRFSDRQGIYIPKSVWKERALMDWNHKNSFQCTMADIGIKTPFTHRVSPMQMPDKMREMINGLRVGQLYTSVTRGVPVPLNPLTKSTFEMSILAGRNPFTRELFDTTKQKAIIDEWDKSEPIQFVVFSHFKKPLQVMPEMLAKKGGKGVYVDGDTPTAQVDDYERDLRAGRLDAIFAQTQSVMEGRTFDTADKFFYLNNNYSLNTRIQSQMRGVSQRRAYPPEVIDKVYQGSWEETVVGRLAQKKKMTEDVVRGMYKH